MSTAVLEDVYHFSEILFLSRRETQECWSCKFRPAERPAPNDITDPKLVQMVTNNYNEGRLFTAQQIMNDPTITASIWQQVDLPKLFAYPRRKDFWRDEDERSASQSGLSYQVD